MISKALNKMQKIPTDGFKGLLGLRGFDQRKAGHVAIHQILPKGFKEFLVVPFEVYKEIMDALCKDAYPAKTAHIGSDVYRVNALRASVYIENLGQLLGRTLKQDSIKMVFNHQVAHAPQRLCAQVLCFIRFIYDVQGVMPLKIESQLRHRLFISQIMDLLKQQYSQSGVEFLGRPAKRVTEKGSHFAYGKFAQNMLPKKSSPRGVHELASFLAKKVPWIEKVGCIVISGVNHLLCP